MKHLIILWLIVTLTSCSKESSPPIEDHSIQIQVFENIIKDNKFLLMSFKSDTEDFTSHLAYSADDYYQWDLSNHIGLIYSNTLQNPSDPFLSRSLYITTHVDETGAYIQWYDFGLISHDMRISNADQLSCSFTLSYSDVGTTYYLHYSKLI